MTDGLKKITKEDLPAIFKKDLKGIKWYYCLECREEVSRLQLGLCPKCKYKKDREIKLAREREEKDYLLDRVEGD